MLFFRILDSFSFGHLSIVNPDIKPAFWITTDPGLISDFRTLPTIIGQRQQEPFGTFQALWVIFQIILPLLKR
jgi:hypothetical protein